MNERRRTLLRSQHRHEKRWQRLCVTRVHRPHNQFVRIEFDYGQGEFQSHGFDDVLVLYFADETQWPSSASAEQSGENFESREYTVRAVNRQQRSVTVEFLLHEGGIATQWALQAAPGQFLWCVPPRMCKGFAEARRTYLFADPCALPAVQRFHEESGSTPGQTVLAGLSTSGEAPELEGQRAVRVFNRQADVAQLIASTDIPQSGSHDDAFVWIAGEARWVAALRRALVKDFGVRKENIQFTGYWRAD